MTEEIVPSARPPPEPAPNIDARHVVTEHIPPDPAPEYLVEDVNEEEEINEMSQELKETETEENIDYQAAKLWAAGAINNEIASTFNDVAPQGSVLDERMHMLEHIVQSYMDSERNTSDDTHLWAEIESAQDMEVYRGVVTATADMPQVHGLDSDKVIMKSVASNDEGMPDTGANINVTNKMANLVQVVSIEPFNLHLAEEKDESNTAKCTHKGLYPLTDDRSGNITYTPMYFNAAVTGTIISPAFILRHSDIFTTCMQTLHKDDRPGKLRFESESGMHSLRIALVKRNDLYYIPTTPYQVCSDFPSVMTTKYSAEDDGEVAPVINKTSHTNPVTHQQQVESELWSARLGQCSENQLDLITDGADGLPRKFHYHPFRYIDYKEEARVKKQPSKKKATRISEAGKSFFMDFAFLRASSKDYTKTKVKQDRIVKSYDGYNSHLVVVDEATSYVWVFLLKSKEPPIETVLEFLKIHGNKDGGIVRTDQGGELARSDEFKTKLLKERHYVVERTGADSPSQNGGAETMNGILGVITRTLLYGADLPAQYWSSALIHAVYLYNRRVHSRTGITPFEGWFGVKPNLKYLRVFGARVCVKKTGHRPAKLDKHSFSGVFLGYSATDQNIVYLELNTGRVLTSHHATFDEAWYLFSKRPPAAQLLYDLGRMPEQEELTNDMIRSNAAPAPHPPMNWVDQKEKSLHDVGVAMNTPLPFHWEQAPNQSIGAAAASVDGGCYEGTVLDPSNYSAIFSKYNISKRDIAQVYMSHDPYADEFTRTIDLRRHTHTSHGAAGLAFVPNPKDKRLTLHHIKPGTCAAMIPRWRSECRGAWLKAINGKTVETVQDVNDAFEALLAEKAKTCEITLAHPEIKHGLTEDGIPQVNLDQLNPRRSLTGPAILPPIIKQATPAPLYDREGEVYIDGLPEVNKLTRGKLMKEDDWPEWKLSEWTQLDQYDKQGMFGDVVKKYDIIKQAREEFGETERGNLPTGIFRLVWTYAKKLAGDVKVRRKSRAAIDGSPRAGQAEIIGPTFANCADQTASRLFYAISAAENLLLYGGDVSNAFAEAPGPEKHFFIQPDKAFKEWWTEHKKRPPLKDDEVITGLRAFQGHPEAARAWDKHSDKILRQIGFTPTVHEPCLYSGVVDGERVLFLRQVDDFAIAASHESIANKILDKIDDFLTFPIKRLGLLKLFNGVDIEQTSEYIKISVESYLNKIMEKHLQEWMNAPDEYPLAQHGPTPLPTKKRFLEGFLAAEGERSTDGTPDMKYQRQMEAKLKISYRSAIGEIIWAMTTCRPDVSHAAVKCSQFSSCPHKLHYHGVRHILKYLYQTKDDGITFWRSTPREDLPNKARPPISTPLNELFHQKRREFAPTELNAQADSDWATCPRTRRSFTGVVVRMAGGTISWKTRLQEVVAQSSAEAELMAANDAGKMILYIRSILWDLGIPQMAATVIGEDNDACTAIGNAQKTSPRTRHMDIRYRALSDWIERDLLILERVDTSVNTSDHLTKLLGRVLFHRHNDYLMGHVPPKYTTAFYELFHPKLTTNVETSTNSYTLETSPTNSTDIGDKVVKSLTAKWDLLCHLVEDSDAIGTIQYQTSDIELWGGGSITVRR